MGILLGDGVEKSVGDKVYWVLHFPGCCPTVKKAILFSQTTHPSEPKMAIWAVDEGDDEPWETPPDGVFGDESAAILRALNLIQGDIESASNALSTVIRKKSELIMALQKLYPQKTGS